MSTVVAKPPPLVPPKAAASGLTRKSSNVHVDISVEKNKDKQGRTIFGRHIIRLSGSLAQRAVIVSERQIRIFLPNSAGVCNLNLIYDTDGQPTVPSDKRNGVYNLLTEQRPDLVHVKPVPDAKTSEIIEEIKAGRFDLIAKANDSNSLGILQDNISISDVQQIAKEDLQLIRIWDNGDYYAYNQSSGKLNKLEETKHRRIFDGDISKYRVLPGDESWNYTSNETANFYRRYLIQDEIDKHFAKPLHPPPVHKYEYSRRSLPEIRKLRTLPRRPNSFLSDFTFKGTSPLKPLQRSYSERGPHNTQLTRDNLLRHEAEQRFGPRAPFLDNFFLPDHLDMEQRKGFDADDALTEQNLKCTVCKNFYDTRDRNPRILHCLHSCCHACLKTRVRGELVQCPVCSEVEEVPNNEINLLPVDHARQHLVKYFKVRNRAQEIGCDSCDPRNRATNRCKECDEFMCGVCTEAHKRTKITKSHALVPVDNLKRSTLDEFHHKRTCPIPEHEDQHFSFYCYSKGCDQPICSLCAVTEHNKADGHDIRNINDVYVENKRLIESLMIDVRHKKNLSEEAIQSIEDEIQNLYIKENSTEEDIDQTFLACQKQLEKRKNELKEKLTATSKAKKKGMESQLDKLINERNSLDHSSKFANNVLGYSDATEFLQIKDSLFGRLAELKEMDIDTRPHNKADVKFHGHKVMEAFQKFTNNLGEVWSTTAFIPNTKIQTYDVGLGREETAMLITLHDYERRPLAEPGVDIRVEVTNPAGKKVRAPVLDLTESEGSYKVLFQGHKMGDHRASVFVMGIPVIDPGVMFKVRRPGALEDDVIRDYEPVNNQMANVKSKIDTGLSHRDIDDDGEREHGQAKDRGQRSYRVFGDIICPDFMLDGSSCHPQNMVTSDSRSLRNVRGRTANIGTAFKNYRGAIATKPFNKAGRFYFEVFVYFSIKRQLRNDLIFEVALSRRGEIDKNYTVDGSPYAWAACARRCPLCKSVCLMAFHNGVRLYHIPLTESAPPGTTLRSTIGFLVDMQAKQWFIVDAKNRRLFYRFKNIDTTKPLWPLFGAYSTEYVSVSLALKTGKDIQAVPDIPNDV